MKKVFLIFIIIFSYSALRAQNPDSLNLKRYIQKINIITPGIEGEILLNSNNNITLNYNLGVNLKGDFGEPHWNNNFYPKNYYYLNYFLSVEARNYINSNNRIIHNRRTDKFSGAYAAFKIEYGKSNYKVRINYPEWTDEGYYPYYVQFGPMIGFQRAIGKVWYWDVNAGVGPSLNNHFFTFTFFSSLKFGIAF